MRELWFVCVLVFRNCNLCELHCVEVAVRELQYGVVVVWETCSVRELQCV